MRRAGSVVAEMHEACRSRGEAGCDDRRSRRRGARGARPAPGPLELPRLSRLSGGGVHLAERSDRARHPGERVLDEGDIVSIDCGAIIEGWHGDAAITVAGRRDRRGLAAPDRRDRAGARRPRSTATGRRTVWATSARPSRGVRTPPASRWCGSTSGTASAPRCTRSPRFRTTARAGRGLRLKEGMVLAIEPMVNAGKATTPRARRRLDGRDRRRFARSRTSSTRGDHRQWSGDPDAALVRP